MRKLRALFAAAAAAAAVAAAAPASAKPPREQSPAPRDLLAGLDFDLSDARAVAAAEAHPLGSLQNPVRVGGPEGERAYLARLRCADGSAPRIGSRGPAGVGAYGSIVSAYRIDCGAAAPGAAQVVMDMYHSEHAERRAPAGFIFR
jgi:hypothetical protein